MTPLYSEREATLAFSPHLNPVGAGQAPSLLETKAKAARAANKRRVALEIANGKGLCYFDNDVKAGPENGLDTKGLGGKTFSVSIEA